MRIAITLALISGGCEVFFPLEAARPDANVVFVTSTLHTGNFGGLVGADSECQNRAMEAGLPGTFVAWLSGGGINAVDRLDGSRGWVRTDGAPVADLRTDLTIRGPLTSISHTESDEDVRLSSGQVWTGTDPNGTENISTCNNWIDAGSANGQVGEPSAGGDAFTRVTDETCNKAARLYCFELGKVAEVVVTPKSGPIMFVSGGTWSPDGGVASADLVCSQEATAARLSGTFRALLGTSNMTAASRFDSTAVYARPDGVEIGTLADARPATFVNLNANGEVGADDSVVWTGGVPTTMGPDDSNCKSWTGVGDGAIGDCRVADRELYADSFTPCDVPHHVYCLQ